MICPVCLCRETVPAYSGTDTLFGTSARVYHLNACSLCGSLSIQPRPGAEEVSGFYPPGYWWKRAPGLLKGAEEMYRRLALAGHVAFIARAARRVVSEGRATRPTRLLDVGCGAGTLLALMRSRGFEVSGVDASPAAALVAASENGVDVRVGSVHDAGLATASFDIITLFHVLEHVDDPRAVLQEAGRILAPGGALVLQVPNVESWQARIFRARWYGLDVPRHLIDYSKRSMERLLDDCGFRVVRVRDFNLRDNAPALASSIAPSLDPVRRAARARAHGQPESVPQAWARHLAYSGLVALCFPFAVLEAAAGCGATVMVEATAK